MRHILIIAGIILSFTTNMIAQNKLNNYAENWEKVTQYEEKDLPQSASTEVEVILKKAIVEKNTQQVIKALLVKNKYKIVIDNADNTDIFNDLTGLLEKTTDEAYKALLHSLLAELYNDYYEADRWKFSSRTSLSDVTPDDMKEWSWNNFSDKAMQHIKHSVDKDKALKQRTTKEFEEIIELGSNSPQYYPTLYDFLMKRTIEQAPRVATGAYSNIDNTGLSSAQLAIPADQFVKLDIKETTNTLALYYYQQYFKDLSSRGMTSTIILTEISKANYISTISYEFRSNNLLDFYKQLAEKYQRNDANAAIIEEIVKINITNSLYSDSDSRNNNLEEAYNWCKKAIDIYPNYPLINNLKNSFIGLEKPLLDINGKPIYYPANDIIINVQHKNLQAGKVPTLRLFQENKFIREYKADYQSGTTYLPEDTTLNIGKLEPGKYRITGNELDSKIKLSFTVSGIAAFSRNNARNEYQVYAVDRISGKPLENASVSVYSQNTEQVNLKDNTPLATLKTNNNGLAHFKNIKELNGSNYFRGSYIVQDKEDVYPAQTIYGDHRFHSDNYYTVDEPDEDDHSISIFTDRAIYRPGQTVYFKGLVINDLRKLVIKQQVTVKLVDNNGDSIEEQKLRLNEFGSVAGEFIIPQSGLLGSYTIEIETKGNQNSTYIQVEEYKRPTFEITFDKVEKTYAFGQEVVLKGYAKNFSGISLQDATVKYTINGKQYSFWWYNSGTSTYSENGEVKTNADGSFDIAFTPKASENRASLWRNNDIQQYAVEVEVTDLNNETQSGNFSLIVGNVSMAIDIEIPNLVEKTDTTSINIEARNLNNIPIKTSGEYKIYPLNENDSIGVQVAKGTFVSGKQEKLRAHLNQLVSGKYRILVAAKDSNGKDVESQKDFIIFSYKDKKPPIKTNEWLVEKNNTFSASKPAEIIFGVSDKDISVLYQLYDNDNVFEEKRITLSESSQLFTIPYKAEYGNQVYLSLTYVKEEKFYNKNISLTKEEEKFDNNLTIKLEVFRDRLRPGQEETWTISVKDAKGSPSVAELLASMYDSSLDKLTGGHIHTWYLNQPYERNQLISSYYYYHRISNYSEVNNQSWWRNYQKNINNSESFRFDALQRFGFLFDNSPIIMIRGTAKSEENRSQDAGAVLQGKIAGVAVTGAVAFNAPVLELSETENLPAPMEGGENIQIRQNFNETAFFFPQLRTNEKGETLVSFTAPESNTKWRFRVLAYDKELNIGQTEQYVVTRKELMVTPNMPRFTREGDKTSISTKISNLSEAAIDGKVYIEFFDPVTEKVIDLNIANREQSFSLEKEASSSAGWTFDIPENIQLLGCRIVATSETFSDGEQHILPVLSNRMMVTESMPFDVTEQGENTFVYDKLQNNQSATLSNYRLTLEYANNPAWYAVMALPTLSTPQHDDAISWFASYYVNSLGSSIMRQYPRAANMIKAWKKQGGDKETLLSKLQQDEELKNVLLAETPWVLDARNETEQMQRLSLLFDLNNTKQKTTAATRKLVDLQDAKGGWSWYKGFYPSRSISQYILIGYAHLQYAGMMEYGDDIKEMQISALNFLDKEIVSDYEQLNKTKDWEKIKDISTSQLEYLYARSYYRDIPITQEARKAERFYTSVVMKNWKNLGLYERSILIPVLIKNGDKKLAQQISKSIRERAVTDKSKGMYWPNNQDHLFHSGIAVVEHTFYMEALRETGATELEMNQMKQWLIKQKQTQAWKTTHATINAIYVLLSTGSNWFDGEEKASVIRVGNQEVNTQKPALGTGYVKTSWDKSEIASEMATVSISKEGSQPAYGALYWQYYEDLNKITGNKTGLNIDKQLFKEIKDNAGKASLVSITEKSPLQVGDKVTVRLTVRSDNDIDFVQIKDMRAPCFEPVESISGNKWNDGTIYYQETRDASTNFYFDRLRKGTYVFEYSVYVNRTGTYANGITTIQSMYAPELSSHTQGINVTVK